MARCTGKWLVVVVCLSGIRTAESLNCTVHLQDDGTALYKISELPKPNCDADWAIDGTVVAYEGHVNETLVQLLTQDSLRLIHRYPNVTYTVDCEKGLVEVSCNGPASSSLREAPHDANQRSRGAILAGGVIALLVLLSVGVCWWKNKGCGRSSHEMV